LSVQTLSYGPTHSASVHRLRNKTRTSNLDNKPQRKIELEIIHTRGQGEKKLNCETSLAMNKVDDAEHLC